ncbi:inorganic phosphate transporter [Agromyces sp. G08B096]|uniref:Inorganic phosphate transporter n=1 Tax=Agromyces sp. G08B096 TaxID=3156399 RepID=A0AAU7W557_9MICO
MSAGLALFLVASLFAFVYGSNAGSVLVSIGLTASNTPVWLAVLALGAAVAIAPVLLGTGVATTIAAELVTLDGEAGRWLLVAAVVSAMLVAAVLSWRGLPTSMTLALLAAMTGVGLGAGTDVSWPRLAEVAAGLLLAPLLGVIAALLLRLGLRPWRTRWAVRDVAGGVHVLAFAALAMAFGAADGQKILAVMAVAMDTVGERAEIVPLQLAVAGVVFAAGAAFGVRRMAATVNRGVLAVRPDAAATSELATAAVMFGGSALGVPAGMSQVVSGSLIGIGMSSGMRRIRWENAARLGNAWVATVPATLLAGFAAGLIVGAVAV